MKYYSIVLIVTGHNISRAIVRGGGQRVHLLWGLGLRGLTRVDRTPKMLKTAN